MLTKLAGELGLNIEEYRQALETRKYKELHQMALDHAYSEAKIKAVPTFIIGETVLQGMGQKDVFEQVIEEEMMKQGY